MSKPTDAAAAAASAKDRFDAAIVSLLQRWVAQVRARAGLVNTAILLLTIPLLLFAALNLGVNVDTVRVLHPETPSRITLEAFAELFPILNDAVIVVIDAQTSEQARDAVDELQAALAAEPEHYRDVYAPGSGDFFARNGLLYLSLDELDDFADELSRAQPLIAELEHGPNLVDLAELVEQGLDNLAADGSDDTRWTAVLDLVGNATHAVHQQHPVPVSWEELLLGDATEVSTRRVLFVDARIDPNSLFDARRAGDRLREMASELNFGPERGVVMRLTGNPMLNYEEIVGLLWDIGGGGLLCFLFVVIVLQRALRSFRMVVAAVSTLLIGLVWTGAFAAAAVGNLNVVSLSFAILFIGLGVDFTIHLGMHYAAARRKGEGDAEAMDNALEHVGSSLVICTATTAVGFYSFIPTYYLGVAELGLIAGSGMFGVLFLTLTFFPALLSSWLWSLPAEAAPHTFRLESRATRMLAKHPAAVRWAALGLALAALATIPTASFDANSVLMRDSGTESVQTFNELLTGEDEESPWFANALAPDFAAARELADRLAALEVVSTAITIEDYVPSEQEEKREMLADLAFLLQPAPPSKAETATPEQERAALARLAALLRTRTAEAVGPELAASMTRLEAEIEDFLTHPDPDASLLTQLKAVLLEPLPRHIARLRRALEPDTVTLDGVPHEITRRMISADGRVRVQAFPENDLRQKNELARFVHAVLEVESTATGMAVNLVGFGDATVDSFRQALVLACSLITLLLLVLWRRIRETLLVLAPLLLGAALTVAGMVVLGLSFNFVNVVVIPLLLGIGVDSGIHLVHRASSAGGRGKDMLESTTARAVLFSALTTIVSFGALALSSHRGMSSLGVLLMTGLMWMLLCNLVVLPALLDRFPASGGPHRGHRGA
ncbi:MAG: MMPL family transporter [Deltaproteobacteria bacterium]|nr:MMPL family transporter [Deltaproteobacteria bacterium]